MNQERTKGIFNENLFEEIGDQHEIPFHET
jgi:hypothetical protein